MEGEPLGDALLGRFKQCLGEWAIIECDLRGIDLVMQRKTRR